MLNDKNFTPIDKPKTLVKFNIDEQDKCYTALNPLIEQICQDHDGKHDLRINVNLGNTNFIK